MPEYATSVPTGYVSGKMWRRRLKELRVIMYTHRVADHAYMAHFDVVLRQGPKPPGYCPPDWGNYARWKKEKSKRSHEE